EQEVEVDESVLCITDDSGVIGLGGIMGGESTKADAATRNIFLESAFFYPEAVAGRARRYNFASDASHRFERGVDFANNVDGFERIAAHPPRVHAAMLPAPEMRRPLHALRERLAAADYREVINFSFVEPGWEADFSGAANPIRLLNPIASHQSVMRTTLIGSLIEVVRKNHSRKVPRIRVVE